MRRPLLALASCFGAGYWDDIRVTALQQDIRASSGRRLSPVAEPSPFNPSTTIRMQLDNPTSLRVIVYDLRGRRVRTLNEGMHPAGPVELPWDGRDGGGRELASGTYLVQVTTPEEAAVIRAVLVR